MPRGSGGTSRACRATPGSSWGRCPSPTSTRSTGCRPSISIQQKTGGRNPRSTVGTITEIYDYLRVLFARVGQGHCPQCGRPITAQTREQIVARILDLPAGTRFQRAGPGGPRPEGRVQGPVRRPAQAGYVRARVDGQVVQPDRRPVARPPDQAQHRGRHRPAQGRARGVRSARLAEAVEQALKLGEGTVIVAAEGQPDLLALVALRLHACGLSFDPPSPQLFSFNSPQGMCPACDGLGVRHDFDPDLLVPDPSLSVWDGAIAPIGPVKEMGRWRRHIFEGVAANLEADPDGPPKGTMLKGPWRDLDERLQQRLALRHRRPDHRPPLEEPGQDLVARREVGGRGHRAAGQVSRSRPAARPAAQLEKYMRSMTCPDCRGARLNPQARAVRVGGKTLVELGAMPIGQRRPVLRRPGRSAAGRLAPRASTSPLDPVSRTIAEELLKEIRGRLGFLINVGLALPDARPHGARRSPAARRSASAWPARSAAGWSACSTSSTSRRSACTRATTTGCSPRSQRLRDMGNTVVVVEHDEDTMRAADHLVDFGPGPGVRGGEVVAAGHARRRSPKPRRA